MFKCSMLMLTALSLLIAIVLITQRNIHVGILYSGDGILGMTHYVSLK